MSLWTSDDVATLKAAIAKGVLRVAYASGSVEYRSLDDMFRVLDRMEAELSGDTGAGQAIFAGRVQ